MPRQRYGPKPVPDDHAIPFVSAEEAWFWFARCQKVRLEGARFESGSSHFKRPCDPDDIYRAAIGLARQRLITRRHLQALGLFGLAERPPDARSHEEEQYARLWQEALDRLATVLRSKGIVA